MITGPTLLATLILCMLILALPRRSVLPVYIVAMVFVPADQAVVIAGLDFKVLRILGMFGVLRVIINGENRKLKLTTIDKLVLAWAISGTIAFTIMWGTVGAFINRLGVIIDILFLYYVFRIMLKDFKDIEIVFKTLLISCIALTPLVAYELQNARNPFAIMGRSAFSIREGKVRCSGAFSHAILLGSFSSAVVPIAFAYCKKVITKETGKKILWIVATMAAIFITFASASSGPLMAMVGSSILLAGFKLRKHIGKATYAFVAMLVVLHFAMSKPVWHLVARIDFTGGSTGWHRYHLIDKSITHFWEWAFVGVKSVAPWGIWAGDVTSMYILQGVNGGFVTFMIFNILIFTMCRFLWKLSLQDLGKRRVFLVWTIFASTMAHVASFLSVAYFGQILMMLIMWFAMTSFLMNFEEKRQKELKRQQQKEREQELLRNK